MSKAHRTKRVSRRSKESKKQRHGKGKVNKFFLALKRLKGMKSNQQREALKMSNNAFIRQMCAHVKKLRHASVPAKLKKRMLHQKKNLRKLILPTTSMQVKRKMLTQRGGFLPLIMAALPVLGSMVGNIISAARSRD